ncbi:hypothetical protein P153DRAFT_424623 [Dothidotthia symphoricarpi CBS 119687]|uniref:Uncharacterized protein n=1 Tax=Dothidotthia symphoricarpi CBS 119687 TaxID=1392245 RepID=A0A6A6A842_9PLEO|nr:uncharacterized protein P153DRAFT_424623 [Dothidotthia symphoricarpi CBS 119687]KAF2127375.1 hypothetical protein P153DRAFT_424623 [Dothidotthia symphoricarpi CBS 119687]
MYTQLITITIAILSTTSLASQAFTNANAFGAMLRRGDAIAKRQGYTPDTVLCGSGDTCEEACGAGQVECPSSSISTLYCHDSTDGSHCCSDGSGNSCDAGFYCTTDGTDTYCCLNSIDTSACAAVYSLSASLIRETASVIPSAALLSSSVPAETPASTSRLIYVSSTVSSASASASESATSSSTTSRSSTRSASATLASPTSASPTPSQFSGAAAKVGVAGMAVLAGGLAGLL